MIRIYPVLGTLMCGLGSSNDHKSPETLGGVTGFLLAAYKLTLSPLFHAFGTRCRYVPTCSEYAAAAVSRHGAWAGLWMATARLARCHPFGGSGLDPVPDVDPSARWYLPWRYGVWRQKLPEVED
ncbi:MAG: membrane protein insertion efficiency factor YidD [Pseudomonadota bacterium]